MSLLDLSPNIKAEIEQANSFLASRGIAQGEKIKVLRKCPLLVQIGESKWGLDPEIAKEIKVRIDN